MIKYSFGKDEEFVAIKEHEYDDLTSTNEDASTRTKRSFVGWTKDGWTSLEKKLTKLVKYQSSGILCVCCSHAVIMEYLMKISKKARILELKRRHLKITDSDIQHAVYVPALH
ncbi:hypothetical protein Tco_1034689 [Tanacetum coccineum]